MNKNKNLIKKKAFLGTLQKPRAKRPQEQLKIFYWWPAGERRRRKGRGAVRADEIKKQREH